MLAIAKICKTFFLYKFIQFVIIALCPTQFDTSTDIILFSQSTSKHDFIKTFSESYVLYIPSSLIELVVKVLERLVVWDNVYFTNFFVSGVKYEHEFVFCPLWWRFIKMINFIGLNGEIEDNKESRFYFKLLEAVIVSNLCHLGAAILLYYLTIIIFSKSNFFKSKEMELFATRTSILYVLSPAGVFLTCSYSESPCAFLCFACLLLREYSINYNCFDVPSKRSIKNPSLYILSGSFLAIAYGIRSNSILLGFIYLYDLYNFLILNKKVFKDSILAILAGSQLFLAFAVSNYHAYTIFCPQRGAWCQKLVPLFFSYAQSHYWDNGFLTYWTPNNIPNFAFAIPTVCLSILSIKFFIFRYPFQNIVPILVSQGLLVILSVFFLNVQIITRIASFLPIIYWYLGSTDILNTKPEEKTIFNVSIQYFIIWGLIQTAMFAAFLPPA